MVVKKTILVRTPNDFVETFKTTLHSQDWLKCGEVNLTYRGYTPVVVGPNVEGVVARTYNIYHFTNDYGNKVDIWGTHDADHHCYMLQVGSYVHASYRGIRYEHGISRLAPVVAIEVKRLS
jgi:hypothetical protein